MMQNEKDEIRSELVGILEPIENVRTCLKKISLSDEWAPAKEYFVRRHEILGIISFIFRKYTRRFFDFNFFWFLCLESR